ncbi:hypothetical protein GQ53DRAFT_17326 [Thozetella sp. PMI_491]|nr:hypothetical protein GQ53DRAFT_17326 [Thozetella sp. PMI_491]
MSVSPAPRETRLMWSNLVGVVVRSEFAELSPARETKILPTGGDAIPTRAAIRQASLPPAFRVPR